MFSTSLLKNRSYVHRFYIYYIDAVSRDTTTRPEVVTATLGEPVSFDCTYNCSAGFVRGEWKWEDTTRCSACQWLSNHHKNKSEDMCTVNLYTANLTLEQTHYNYTCVSVMNDQPDLPHKIERIISLRVQGMKLHLHETIL